jgi:hypothetical protein
MPLTDQEREYYRSLLEQDFKEAPLTDSQQGEQAGVRSYNEMVDPVNQTMKSGEPMRRKFSPESMEQMTKDRELLDKSQFLQESPGMEIGRDPAAQNAAEDLLFGKQTSAIPTLPALDQPGQYVTAPNYPKLTDIAVSQSSAAKVPLSKAASTAPKIVTEEETAAAARGSKERIENDLSGAPGFFDIQKQGFESKFNADEASAVVKNQMLEQRQKEIQAMMEDNANREKEALRKAEEATSQLKQINPNRIWENTSIWAKLSLVAGAALQGRAGSDSGLKMMQSMIENDIRAQEKDMDAGVKKQGSLLEALKPYAQNKEQLIKMANEISMEIAKNYGEAIKANVGKGAAPALAIEKTMQEYTKPLLAEQNKATDNLLKASSQEQARRSDDAGNFLKLQEQQLSNARLKFDSTNMSESDAKRLEGAAAMSIAASRMEDIENDKNFDPTAVSSAITSYMQKKGIPGSLNPEQAEWVSNYISYFSHKRQALTGAAGSETEDERIKLLVAPDKTFRKGSLKMYQGLRGKDINKTVNSLNSSALLRVQNIPEMQRYIGNRSKMQQPQR